jgi:hypothetical protein
MLRDPNDAACHFSGAYSIAMQVECRPSAVATCPLTSPAAASVTFALASSSHCGEVVERVGLTMTVASFEGSGAEAAPKDDFIDQQTMFFRAQFSSPTASISAARIRSVTLAHAVGSTQHLVYERPAATAAGESVAFATAGGAQSATFQMRSSASLAGAPSDGSAQVIVRVVGEVDYAFQGATRRAELAAEFPVAQTQALTGSQPVRGSSSRIRVTSSRAGAPASDDGTASSNWVARLGGQQAVTLGALGVALVAALLVAALLVARRRRQRGQQELLGGEGVEGGRATLTTSSSHASLELASAGAATAGGKPDEEVEVAEAAGEAAHAATAVWSDLRQVRESYDSLNARANGATAAV